jgi:hypothetical protein
MDDILYTLDSRVFADQLPTSFKLHDGNAGPPTLQLVEVGATSTPPNIELFSPLFRGPRAPRANQENYRCENEKLRGFGLFMTVIGADAESTTYDLIHRLHRKKP